MTLVAFWKRNRQTLPVEEWRRRHINILAADVMTAYGTAVGERFEYPEPGVFACALIARHAANDETLRFMLWKSFHREDIKCSVCSTLWNARTEVKG